LYVCPLRHTGWLIHRWQLLSICWLKTAAHGWGILMCRDYHSICIMEAENSSLVKHVSWVKIKQDKGVFQRRCICGYMFIQTFWFIFNLLPCSQFFQSYCWAPCITQPQLHYTHFKPEDGDMFLWNTGNHSITTQNCRIWTLTTVKIYVLTSLTYIKQLQF
jgi:hypothetical protein